jgi:hypothetical protein
MIFKWIAACMACAIFPLRDVEQGESLPPMYVFCSFESRLKLLIHT